MLTLKTTQKSRDCLIMHYTVLEHSVWLVHCLD